MVILLKLLRLQNPLSFSRYCLKYTNKNSQSRKKQNTAMRFYTVPRRQTKEQILRTALGINGPEHEGQYLRSPPGTAAEQQQSDHCNDFNPTNVCGSLEARLQTIL